MCFVVYQRDAQPETAQPLGQVNWVLELSVALLYFWSWRTPCARVAADELIIQQQDTPPFQFLTEHTFRLYLA